MKIKLPLKYHNIGQHIFDADNKMILDLRGWGWMQYLKEKDIKMSPSQFQDNLGNKIVEILNKELSDTEYVE